MNDDTPARRAASPVTDPSSGSTESYPVGPMSGGGTANGRSDQPGHGPAGASSSPGAARPDGEPTPAAESAGSAASSESAASTEPTASTEHSSYTTAAQTGETRSQRRRRESGKKPKKSGIASWLKELPLLLAIAFVLALLIKTFIIQAFFIPSGSMETTLHGCPGCSGDRILVNKVPYYFSDPDPGEIVVFKGPESWAPEFEVDEPDTFFGQAWLAVLRAVGAAPPDEKDFVKRVIAVGGQTVACCDPQGRVTVDGEPLDEPYIHISGDESGYTPEPFGPVTVPEGRLFVMGDHRNGSADSRAHIDDGHHGTISVDDVIGEAFVVVWPLDRFAWLSTPDIQGQSMAFAPAAAAQAAPLGLGLAFATPFLLRRRRSRPRWGPLRGLRRSRGARRSRDPSSRP